MSSTSTRIPTWLLWALLPICVLLVAVLFYRYRSRLVRDRANAMMQHLDELAQAVVGPRETFTTTSEWLLVTQQSPRCTFALSMLKIDSSPHAQ